MGVWRSGREYFALKIIVFTLYWMFFVREQMLWHGEFLKCEQNIVRWLIFDLERELMGRRPYNSREFRNIPLEGILWEGGNQNAFKFATFHIQILAIYSLKWSYRKVGNKKLRFLMKILKTMQFCINFELSDERRSQNRMVPTVLQQKKQVHSAKNYE